MSKFPPATPRLRGRKLQQRRARWFSQHPLCVRCKAAGRITLATELDHVVPLHKGGADDESNLAGLCHSCHLAKTAEDLGARPRRVIGLDGYPVDPDHHWQRG